MAKKKTSLKKGDVVILKKSGIELTIIGETETGFVKEMFFIAKINKGQFKGETFHIKEEEIIKKVA